MENTDVVLTRDVDAYLIPVGTPVTICAGEEVNVTQALGGAYTVLYNGNLLRIKRADMDALGIAEEKAQDDELTKVYKDVEVDLDQIWDELKQCYDPEIPVNIVELGLIYKVDLFKEETGGYKVAIDMTLTAPGCGMGPILAQDVHDRVLAIKNIVQVDVEIVFYPPWDQGMMTDAAKLQLGML